jgi:hypothetical protein
MRRGQLGVALLLCLATMLFGQSAHAQDVAAAAPAQAVSHEDDDGAFRPLEPDYNLINLPTTLPLPLHKGDFHLTHRFSGNLRQGSFSDNAATLFGIDEGVVIAKVLLVKESHP